MPFRFTPTALPEVILIEPKIFRDERGFFLEAYKRSDFVRYGITQPFVQENQSYSSQKTLRGLHYQKQPYAQGKLIRVAVGEIFDVVVDIRKGSPRYGKSIGIDLSASNDKMLYIPPGFAHAVCVLSETAGILYLVTQEYTPAAEAGIIWNDPALGIDWPVKEPVLSPRDQRWPTLAAADNNFIYDQIRS